MWPGLSGDLRLAIGEVRNYVDARIKSAHERRRMTTEGEAGVQVLQAEEQTDWNDFIDALALDALVPPAYDAYRPAIVDGLIFFLEHLNEVRVLTILGEQALMADDAGINERIVAIARKCPALHKLGQVLARDRRLQPELRQLLQGRKLMPSPLSVEEARALAEAELGPLADLGIRIDEAPLAEASVAVVVPFAGEGDAGESIRGSSSC